MARSTCAELVKVDDPSPTRRNPGQLSGFCLQILQDPWVNRNQHSCRQFSSQGTPATLQAKPYACHSYYSFWLWKWNLSISIVGEEQKLGPRRRRLLASLLDATTNWNVLESWHYLNSSYSEVVGSLPGKQHIKTSCGTKKECSAWQDLIHQRSLLRTYGKKE